ncbi:MAG: alpha/beta hydrolase [Gammaproteobacteria bacterium]|nr:alpha/beta hydrolase [Gammaproteobacteria bacterium]
MTRVHRPRAESSVRVQPGTDSGSFEAPPPTAIIEARLEDEILVPVRRYGNPDGPRLLLSHGNGLAIDLYYPFWSWLLDDFDVIVFDLRNHGANPLGELGRHTVPNLCRDLEAVGRAVDRHFGVRPRAGVYHSVSCLAAVLSPSVAVSYAALVLFDPPFFQPGDGQRVFELACQQAAARTRIRARRFRSERDFIELMRAQPAMARVLPEALRLMANSTLRPDADGYELRCPPEYEAKILAATPRFSRLVDSDALPQPVKVIGADPSLKHYFLPPCDLSRTRSLDFESLSGTTHLAQLEKPKECALRTVDFLQGTGFVRQQPMVKTG